jgi:gamma-glutamyltranspeptidase/glutathione hydrolase
MAGNRGVVAAGHPCTAEAGTWALAQGGNAFDAAVAAFFAACAAEPVLASLGGGGFLLAQPADQQSALYDFFTQTPLRRCAPAELDFHPIVADFGTARQEFHIGMGAVAVPGAVKGMFRVQRELGRLPMAALIEPAVQYARHGVRFNALQSYIFEVVGSIYRSEPESLRTYASRRDPGRLVGHREVLRQPELADTLEALARDGERLFYRGEIAAAIALACRDRGGHLSLEDLGAYRVHRRQPLPVDFRGQRLLTNPPPSSGGMLIAFALKLLEQLDLPAMGYGSPAYLTALAEAMALANEVRVREHAEGPTGRELSARRILDARYLGRYRRALAGHAISRRGTTQVSVIDAHGNLASMTVSNGEGCGHMLPGTGIMLNNMLGEADLNPHGFHRWQPGRRLSSMMAPTLALAADGRRIAIGSGGSNRIRTAILQVLLNLLAFDMPVARAVRSPRIHLENGLLSIEPGLPAASLEVLLKHHPEAEIWRAPNLFFGGVHTALLDRRGALQAAGDPRRGGVARRV